MNFTLGVQSNSLYYYYIDLERKSLGCFLYLLPIRLTTLGTLLTVTGRLTQVYACRGILALHSITMTAAVMVDDTVLKLCMYGDCSVRGMWE